MALWQLHMPALYRTRLITADHCFIQAATLHPVIVIIILFILCRSLYAISIKID